MALVLLVCLPLISLHYALVTDILGPTIVSTALVPDPSVFRVRGLKNGKVLQDCGCE
jgi:hypothetical protein